MERPLPARPILAAALLLALAATGAGPALADRAPAEAALPTDGVSPLFTVTTTTTTSGDWDDLPRLPEYCVYPNGTFLVQKSDERLWVGRLSRDQTVEFLQFLLDDARIPSIDMTYIVSSPLARRSAATRSRRRTGPGACGAAPRAA